MDVKYETRYTECHDVLIDFIQTDDAFPMRDAVPENDYDYVDAIYDFLDTLKKGELYNMKFDTMIWAYMGFFITHYKDYIEKEDEE